MTGAGRGIGRAYARLLAARGARVVVNDLGGSVDGAGVSADVAAAVVAEIVADGAGDTAVADGNDVSSESGAQALVAHALDAFGRIDIVINNAGIVRWAAFPELDDEILAQHLAVHVGGAFHTTRAAWPHMVSQGYGRVVMTTSSGIFGLPNNGAYATAKAAVIGLTRSLSLAGAAYGVKANLIAPAAATRMGGDEAAPEMAPDLVAPMAAYLAHEDCPVSGEIYAAGFGRFARVFIATTEGYVHTGGEPTIEDVAAHWSTINDEAGYHVPADLPAWAAEFDAPPTRRSQLTGANARVIELPAWSRRHNVCDGDSRGTGCNRVAGCGGMRWMFLGRRAEGCDAPGAHSDHRRDAARGVVDAPAPRQASPGNDPISRRHAAAGLALEARRRHDRQEPILRTRRVVGGHGARRRSRGRGARGDDPDLEG